MRDFPMILGGLAMFLALVTLPVWYNAMTKTSGSIQLDRPAATKCVAPVEVMRRIHMEMLSDWRDRRVRGGVVDGGSLNHTCLEQCHRDRTQFCDRCHAYVGLRAPDCWSCHDRNRGTDDRFLSSVQALPRGNSASTGDTKRSSVVQGTRP